MGEKYSKIQDMKDKTEMIGIRINPEFKKTLEARAKKEKRTLSKFIRRLLLDSITRKYED